MSEGLLQQNLSEVGEFQQHYMMYLLFEEAPELPSADAVKEALLKRFPDGVDIAESVENCSSFKLSGHTVEDEEGAVETAQLLLGTPTAFDGSEVDALARSQQWECPESEKIFAKAKYKLLFSDHTASDLPYSERCELLTLWSETVVELFPGCIGVWFAASGKLLTPTQIKENSYEDGERFLLGGLNIRYFAVDGTRDYLVDTVGLYAVGLPDVQYFFNTLDPDDVVNHAFSVAAYQFNEDAPIEDGETVDGFSAKNPEKGNNPEIQWTCKYGESLLQPKRDVLSVEPGRFAAGAGKKKGKR